MKPLAFHDPEPSRNEYASKMYLGSLYQWLDDNGRPYTRLQNLVDAHGMTVVTNGDYLTPAAIMRLKNEGCDLVSFDINDSSWLTDAYRTAPEIEQINIIFKIAGIQRENVNRDVVIDRGPEFSPHWSFRFEPRGFLLVEWWELYRKMADQKRLQSLPYVPWAHNDAPERSWDQRSGKVLVRGGNHFWRFMTALELIHRDALDPRSSFATADYFREDMHPQFRYCEACRKDDEFWHADAPKNCTTPELWASYPTGWLDLSVPNRWNNRCPKAFDALAQEFFHRRYGIIKMNQPWKRVLHGRFEAPAEFQDALAGATMYADLKWWPSIYCPPRFWEAANAGTVNFLPRRTNDQEYFPDIRDGDDYVTFSEDFEGFDPTISREKWEAVSFNARELYRGWIQPGRYKIAERLCRHIMSQIEKFCP